MFEIPNLNIIQYAHYGYVYCMLLLGATTSPSDFGETLVSGGGDGTIKLWALSKPKGEILIRELAVMDNGDSSILSMAINETLLYAGRLEGEVNVWDLDTRQLIQTIKAFNVDVLSLAVRPGFLFTGGADGRIKVNIYHSAKRHELIPF